jgi:hypothetical protein
VDDVSPREFLNSATFDPNAVGARFPNARRNLRGGLFISHSGVDTARIRSAIMPIAGPRFAPDGAFLHSRSSGGAEDYRQLVQAALHLCASFMLVLSRASLANEWVQAEVEWVLSRSRPMILVRFDPTEWTTFRDRLQLSAKSVGRPSRVVDFRHDEREGAVALASALDAMSVGYPSQRA